MSEAVEKNRHGIKMISLATKHNDAEATLGWSERIGYGAGNFSLNLINAILASFLLVYFTNVSLVDAAAVSTIMAVSKIFDGISDLVMGNIVDRTNSKLGKARVWLLRMCIPFSVSAVLLFSVPASMPDMVKYVYVFILYNLVNTICFTAIAVPYNSMNYLMSRNRYERGFLGNINQIFMTVANITINTFFIKLLLFFGNGDMYQQKAWTITVSIVGIISILVFIFTFVSTKERVIDLKEKQQKDSVNPKEAVKSLFRNKYWVTLTICMFIIFFVIVMYSVAAVYYIQYVIGNMGYYAWIQNGISIGQFAIMFFTPLFMKKFGKHRVYQTGLLLMIIGFTAFGFCEGNIVLMVIFSAFKGIGLGTAGGMAFGMVADTIDYGEWKTGIRAVGMGNAGVSAAQKLGLGLGTAIMGWIITGAGFDATLAVQSKSAITAISFCYNWIPVIMLGICFILMLFYRLDKEFPTIMKELKERENVQ